MKKKKESLMDAAKDTMKLGIVSNTGMYAVGTLGGMAGPAATPITNTVGAGLALANVGRLAKTGMTVADQFTDSYSPQMSKTDKPKYKKSTTTDRISRII